MNALLILCFLGYIFGYISYFIDMNKPSRSAVYEAATILAVHYIYFEGIWSGWTIFLIVWSSFWMLVSLTTLTQNKMKNKE